MKRVFSSAPLLRRFVQASAPLCVVTSLLSHSSWVMGQAQDAEEALNMEQIKEKLLQQAGEGGLATPNAKTVVVKKPGKVVAPARPGNGPTPGFPNMKGVRPFGENVLGSGRSIPTLADLPVPADYIVGPGDIIELRYFGKENRSFKLPVDRTGTIVLPEIGPISVNGMTFEAVGAAILERINKQKIGIEASVTIGQMRSIQVALNGEVQQPGAYTVDALSTVTNALILGGGITPSGSLRKIEVRRGGKVVTTLDLYATLLRGDNKNDIRLMPGDTIFVPTVGRRVAVTGDVLRPAIFELLEEKNAGEVIQLAGGFLPTAYPQLSRLNRLTGNGQRQTSEISLMTAEQRKMALKDGDVVTVGSALNRLEKTVSLRGAVERTGAFEWKKGMKLSQLVPDFDALQKDAYRLFAVIQRIDPVTGIVYYKSVNLAEVLQGHSDEVLEKDDEIIVFNHAHIEFLSSASVQSVLAGRPIDKPKGGRTQVRVNAPADDTQKKDSEDAAQLKGLALFDSLMKRDTDRFAASRLAQADGSTDASGDGASNPSTDVGCSGLQELATIIDGEGSERFNAAILGRGGNKDLEILKVMACPEIFNAFPRLLPYVLEQSVVLRGEIMSPGVLPIAERSSLDLALRVRGGLTREADKQSIELTRVVGDRGGQAETQRMNLSVSDLATTQLTPGDTVNIRKRATDKEVGVVRLRGEFMHPGTYDLKRGEKLSSLVQRAGGLTPQAYPYGAIFLRERIKNEKKEFYGRATTELQNSMVTALSKSSIYAGASGQGGGTGAAVAIRDLIHDLSKVEPSGRMVVEADPTVLQVQPELDVILEAGDEVVIPKRPSYVMVMGEVLNPGAVQFKPGMQASDYLRAAGGFTRLSDESRAYLILPNGSAEPVKLSSWNLQPAQVPPGSTVYIPREAVPLASLDYLFISLSVFKDLALSAAALKTVTK